MNSVKCNVVGSGTPEKCAAPAPGTRHHMLLNSNEVPQALDSEMVIIQSVISKAHALPGEIIDLMCLQSLYVSHPEILGVLRFPVLEQIWICVEEDGDPDITTFLEPSFARSSSSLRTLCFHGCPAARTTVTILQQFPFITELLLVIDTPGLSDEVEALMQILTVSSVVGSRVVAPQLCRLAFGYDGETNIPCDLYL
ncbi:hypothetical protein B0H19DRAFT_1369229 [Mycena capillaripes]|nr:hypothetical protein B0H19DRAFT_1369229 [Mycena capillaripes]